MICFSQQRDGFRFNESTNDDDDLNFIKCGEKFGKKGRGKGGHQSNWIKREKAIALPFFFFFLCYKKSMFISLISLNGKKFTNKMIVSYLQGLTFFLSYAILAAVLGMLQFGYNTGVINAPELVSARFF